MNNITTFNHNQFGAVRTVTDERGEPWFVATDIATALGYRNAPDMTRRLDEDEKGTRSVRTLGGNQEVTVISEAGLYSSILGSKLPAAKEFKRWVTHEVLPSIRKHGGYLTPAKVEEVLLNPDTIIQLATQLKNEREQRAALEAQAEVDRPKVLFADALTVSDSAILVGQLAKLLSQNGIHIGQNRLFQRLREEGYLHKHGRQKNLPTQKSCDLGVIDIKTRTVNNPDGTVRTTYTPVVTGKGQQYFINHYLTQQAA